jgi:hypothetical protein
MKLNADLTAPAFVRASGAAWAPSPEPGVDRLMLERDGEEIARATSIVRYAPGSRFKTHRHDLGEEFLVLEGVFSDEHGGYPVGTYVRNPPGSSHAPSSRDGCVIFVKLRQMQTADQTHVVRRTAEERWPETDQSGVSTLRLYESASEAVALIRLAPRGRLVMPAGDGRQECLVVAGDIHHAGHGELRPWDWFRTSDETVLTTSDGATLWTKRVR